MNSLEQLLPLALMIFCTETVLAGSARDQVVTAAKALGESSGYSWTTSMREADGRSGPLGSIEGKAEKAGTTWLTFTISGLPIEVYKNKNAGTAKVFEGWQSFDEVARMGATPAAVVRFLRAYQNPATEAAALADKSSNFKKVEEALTGDLSEETVKEMLLLGARSRDGKEPQASDAKGSIKFWLKDGALTRYEISIQGKVASGERESNINRTIAVEIKNVGTTQLDVPADAKAKMI